MTDLKNNLKLHSKIEAVSNEIGYQEKKDKNTFSKYNFTSNEQMMTAVRGALLNNKLSLTCDIVDYEEKEYVNNQGKQTIRSIVKIEVTITDLETGFSKVSRGIGAEQDTQGKSMQQAVTQAFKYWIFKNFKVSSQMEKDPDSKSTEVQQPKVKTAKDVILMVEKCTTVSCVANIFNQYSKLPGVKAACTKQRKFIESQSKTK